MKAVIFDLDGTLIDSAPDIHAAANAVLQGEGLPPVTFAQSRSFVGGGARIFVERMERAVTGGNDAARTNHLHARFLHFYERAHENTRIYPGVVDVLAALRAEGVALGLCTNKPMAPTRAVLTHLGWDAWFDMVIGGDSLPVAKPDPAPLIATVDGLGLTLPQITYIGDSETDAETARRAGARFGLFTEGYRHTPPDEMHHQFRFSDYQTLIDHLRDPAA